MGTGRLLERLARCGAGPAVSEIRTAAIAPGRESKLARTGAGRRRRRGLTV